MTRRKFGVYINNNYREARRMKLTDTKCEVIMSSYYTYTHTCIVIYENVEVYKICIEICQKSEKCYEINKSNETLPD